MSGTAYITQDVQTWIRSKLISDATLLGLLANGANSVYADVPAQGADYPCIVIQYQSPLGLWRAIGTGVMYEGFLYLVKVLVTMPQTDTAATILKRVHTLIEHESNQTQGDADILWGEYRESPPLPADDVAGAYVNQKGTYWEVYARAS